MRLGELIQILDATVTLQTNENKLKFGSGFIPSHYYHYEIDQIHSCGADIIIKIREAKQTSIYQTYEITNNLGV